MEFNEGGPALKGVVEAEADVENPDDEKQLP